MRSFRGIRAGDHVTYRDATGAERNGRASALLLFPGHVVVDTGGPHGRPFVVNDVNYVRHAARPDPHAPPAVGLRVRLTLAMARRLASDPADLRRLRANRWTVQSVDRCAPASGPGRFIVSVAWDHYAETVAARFLVSPVDRKIEPAPEGLVRTRPTDPPPATPARGL